MLFLSIAGENGRKKEKTRLNSKQSFALDQLETLLFNLNALLKSSDLSENLSGLVLSELFPMRGDSLVRPVDIPS